MHRGRSGVHCPFSWQVIVGFPDSSNLCSQTKVHCVRYSLVEVVQFPLSGSAFSTVTEGHVITGDKEQKKIIFHYLYT